MRFLCVQCTAFPERKKQPGAISYWQKHARQQTGCSSALSNRLTLVCKNDVSLQTFSTFGCTLLCLWERGPCARFSSYLTVSVCPKWRVPWLCGGDPAEGAQQKVAPAFFFCSALVQSHGDALSAVQARKGGLYFLLENAVAPLFCGTP